MSVNVPLLRKAVEWAEAEASKPGGGHWCQATWKLDLDASQENAVHIASLAQCGTAFCIAGWVAAQELGEDRVDYNGFVHYEDGTVEHVADFAADALGIAAVEDADDLFAGGNSIERVREVAEAIAGEPL